jgi:hypothetical protein
MVDLVLEQVEQKAIRPLRLHARASVYLNNSIYAGRSSFQDRPPPKPSVLTILTKSSETTSGQTD